MLNRRIREKLLEEFFYFFGMLLFIGEGAVSLSKPDFIIASEPLYKLLTTLFRESI